MQKLIVCIAEAYEATAFQELTTNNSDAWITELWKCYHPYQNYGAYCMVTASTILNQSAALAKQQGQSNCPDRSVPNSPTATSANGERTLYGNVYDTLQELQLSDATRVDQTPAVGSMFMRPGDTGRNNHAGIVVDAPLRDDLYIETIEGNVSTSGNGTTRKGFQRVRYTKAGYDDFAARAWVQSARAASYKNARPVGWYYYHAWKNCNAAEVLYSAQLCLGVTVNCDYRATQTPTPPATGGCSPNPPANEAGFTEWMSVKGIIDSLNAKRTDNRAYTLIPDVPEYPIKGRQFSADGCYVRWTAGTVVAPPPTPPTKSPCPEGLFMKSCCEGAATTLNFPGKTQMLGLADMKSVGGRRALMSTALNIDTIKAAGFETRYVQAAEMWPQVRLSNGSTVTVIFKGSDDYRYADQYGLFGPSPAIIELDRTQIYQGEGAGWVERVADMFAPGSTRQVDPNDVIVRDDLSIVKSVIQGNRLSLFDVLQKLDENPEIYKGRQPVIVFSGEVTTGVDVLQSAAGVIGAGLNVVVPGIGSLVTSAINLAADAYRSGTITLQDAFSFVGALASGLANAANDNANKKMFGVDAKVFQDITKYSATSYNVYGVLSTSGGGLQKAQAIGAILQRDVPEIGRYISSEFATEEAWIRGAFAQINSTVSGALTSARASVQNVADSFATSTVGNLKRLFGDRGTDGLFADLLTDDSLGFTKSVAKISTFQELLTSSPHPSMLNARAGAQDIFGRLLSLPATFAADVRDGVVHNAIASVVTGKRIVDGALDQLTLDSLLYKAEDFAKKKWKFDVPPTIPEDKRECFQREIAVCVGTECCPPKVLVGGECKPPGTATAKPDCIREQNGQLLYCEPQGCKEGAVNVPSKAIETATVTLKTDSGTPYELTASRPAGTTNWGNYEILVYEPEPGTNGYRRPVTQPVPATGVNIASADFESIRTNQNAPITTLASNATSGTPQCVTVRPARATATGYEVMTRNGWMALVGCCPSAQPGPTTTTRPTADCCDEIRMVSSKVDQLSAMIAELGGQYQPTVTRPTLTPTDVVGSGTGIAPQSSTCDLSQVIALIKELPSLINRVDAIDASRVAVDGSRLSPDVNARSAQDVNNLATMQAALTRIETAIGGIKTGGPCDNTEILSALVKIQAQLQKATIGYDDKILQGKVDTVLQLLRQGTGTNLDAVLGELQAARRDYADVMERLKSLATANVQVCDTATLRRELEKQTASIAEIRTLLQNGQKIDTTAIEREVYSQRELLNAIVERLNQGVVVTGDRRTTDNDMIQTVVKCDDAYLKAALSELKQMFQICPVLRKDLQEFRTSVDQQFSEIKGELATATNILRELQGRQSSEANIEAKLDAVINRLDGKRGPTTNTTTTKTSTEECTDCPAYVEEHRKVFYRYPTAGQAQSQQQQQQQQQTQIQQAYLPSPQIQVVPVEMPCDFC
ncbi:MAG: hypothetical protein FGM22_07385 [Burkholderiaceae bacterium]|nr:hypothetical protein [Burkholderiaceae bacterium]